MKKQITILACLLAVCCGITSCSELRSKHHVGDIVPLGEDDLSEQTIWMKGDEVYYVRRVDSNSCVAATLVWDAKLQKYAAKSFPLFASKLDDHLFLNVKNGDLYTILRAAGSDDGSVVLFTVDKERMEREIAAGKVKAHEEGGHIVMDGTKAEQDAYIASNLNTVFSMDGASVVRLLSEKKPKKEK